MRNVRVAAAVAWIVFGAVQLGCSSGRRSAPVNSRMTVDGISDDGLGADGDGAVDGWYDDSWQTPDGWQDAAPGEPCSQAPYEFSCPCEENDECESGYCVEGPNGFVCSAECVQDCPPGWSCKGVTILGDPIFLCFPEASELCHPCEDHSQCDEGLCVDMSDGRFCSFTCDAKYPCPEEYSCEKFEAGDSSYCIPENGSCACSEDSGGQARPCGLTNQYGTCTGFEICEPAAGWVDCTASFPWKEECDGEDNDCDGEVDEDLPAVIPCVNAVDALGACEGSAHCEGGAGWVCDAPDPEPEECDYSDNDCDGKADEDFMVGNKYGTLQHCGECNLDCEALLPNAVAYCDYTEYAPVCKVEKCLPGFYQLNEFQCIPPPDVQCQPCTDDDGTNRQAYDEYVTRLNALDKKYPNFYFLDVNKKGEHGFEHECFSDFDHLTIRGAKKLSIMLNDIMVKAKSKAEQKNAKK